MFRNFLTIAFRILFRHKAYALINVSGLAVGLASAILILLYVRDELSYDRFHEDHEQIYRVGLNATNQGNEFMVAVSAVPMAPTLLREYPEVKAATRLFTFVGESLVKYKENAFLEDRFFYADSGFFGVFPRGILRGDPATALARANTVVITDEMASKYFGDEDPIGKVIEVGAGSIFDPLSTTAFEVTAVVEKYPRNSHLKFDLLASLESTEIINSPLWMRYLVHTYIRLQEGHLASGLEAKFPDMLLKYVGPQWEQVVGSTMEESLARGIRYGYFLQPLAAIHLGVAMEGEIEPGGSLASIYIFSSIAIFLIIIASINFMNLTTAQSYTRAREVGVRKVVGSTRSKLITQFLTESTLLSFVALGVGILLVSMVLPSFNLLVGKELSLTFVKDRLFLPSLIALGLIVGFLAGSYPSLFISSYEPIQVLPGKIASGRISLSLRGVLVVFQFTVAIILFISTLMVSKQMNFIQRKELGYDKTNLLVINRIEVLKEQKDAFQEDLSKIPEVIQSGFTNSAPTIPIGTSLFRAEGTDAEGTRVLNHWLVGYDLQKTMEMELSAGRWFSRDFIGDSTGVVLNEAATRTLEVDDPLGKILYYIPEEGGGEFPLKIIGIVRDFHYESIHNPIQPLLITFLPSHYSSSMLIRIQPKHMSRTVSLIRRTWKKFAAEQPMEYSFLADDLSAAYEDDSRTGTLFTIFALLAVFISMLGLIGMASYTAVQRTKEIGIRKVVGARESDILRMLSKEVFVYIGIATVFAWPVAYYFMRDWLQNFAYRVEMGFLSFLLASILALVLALLTVGLISYRAAKANPAVALRDE